MCNCGRCGNCCGRGYNGGCNNSCGFYGGGFNNYGFGWGCGNNIWILIWLFFLCGGIC